MRTVGVEHEVHVEPGLQPWLSMTYRAVCECGWKGDWWPFRAAAVEQGDEHLEPGEEDRQ